MGKLLGTLYIVAAPSGGGKTSLVKQLVLAMPSMKISISHTTRQKQPTETDGVDYFFISEADFLEKVAQDSFVEYACVFNHYYGTSKEQIMSSLQQGVDVLLDIDWQGAQQIKRIFPESVSIFIIPPSLETLKERLKARGRDKETVILDRMRQARAEMSHYKEFDFLIVNDNFEKASQELQAIVTAERLRIERQGIRQQKLLSILLAAE